ncbi:FecR family protein [Pedobacter sp. SYP-B3415]|uniref:FecR family protein n=1 Tax=Pedobacter sp. SYP-B3415 TaxID=2496641 RepID=UPI00101C1FED|nr:FecR family protein [Pedobacter sp. SYP-B3415]
MQPDYAQIQRFLNRECTAEEAERVYRYFQDHPEVLERVFSEEEWRAAEDPGTIGPEKSMHMLASIETGLDHAPDRGNFQGWRFAVAIAAVLLCICVSYLYISEPASPPTTASIRPAVVIRDVAWQKALNRTRKASSIRLSDGSRVVLMPGAAIRYAVSPNAKRRQIYLRGEARFYVAKDRSRPFTVYAGPLATTALGTVFNICSRPANPVTTVHLLSGLVKVTRYKSKNRETVYLAPGRELRFDARSEKTSVASFQPVYAPRPVLRSSTSMTGDSLRFVNQKLPEVISHLERVYNIRIHSDLPLKKYYFTGEFDMRKDSSGQVLRTIMLLNKLQYIKTDSSYIIIKK